MFKKLLRKIRSNPLDKLLIKALKTNKKKFLLGWNRGLGDIPLGLYAIVHRIKWFIPDASITFMINPGLEEGFELFPYVNIIVAKDWRRGKPCSISDTLKNMNISQEEFDVIIENPQPAYWVNWQIERLQPLLIWKESFDEIISKKTSPLIFSTSDDIKYIAIQPGSDTTHSPWRDWPVDNWKELIRLFLDHKNIKFILLGKEVKDEMNFPNVIDLRGKTTFLQTLSIIKNKCQAAVLPDGGILSTLYYLNIDFDLFLISLWCDVQGVLKQKVPSPNAKLNHLVLYKKKNINAITPKEVFDHLKERVL